MSFPTTFLSVFPTVTFFILTKSSGQLQKMGMMKDPKVQEAPGSTTKRRSLQPDFSNLGPLKPGGTVGFLNFRDGEKEKRKNSKGKKADDDMDSDDDDDDDPVVGKADDEEGKEDDHFLSPDDVRFQGELAEGVRKIKVSDLLNHKPGFLYYKDTDRSSAQTSTFGCIFVF